MTRPEASRHERAGAPPGPPDIAELRELLRRATEAAKDEDWSAAERHLDSFAKLELGSLDGDGLIARAGELRASLEKRKQLRINRLLIIALFVVAGAVAAMLLKAEVSTVRVVARVATRTLDVETGSPMAVANIGATRVELTGIQAATVSERLSSSDAPLQPSRRRWKLDAAAPLSQLILSGPGFVLDTFDAGSGASMLLETEGDPGQFQIQISGAKSTGSLASGNPLEFVTSHLSVNGNAPDGTSDSLAQGGSVTFDFGSSTSTLNVTRAATAPVAIARNVLVSKVQFKSRDVERLESGIHSGEIRLSEFDAEPIQLVPGDRLTMVGGDRLQATNLTLGEAYELHLNGEVSLLELNGRSLKPSMLSWMQEHQEATLFVAGLASLLSAAWLVMTRLEILRT